MIDRDKVLLMILFDDIFSVLVDLICCSIFVMLLEDDMVVIDVVELFEMLFVVIFKYLIILIKVGLIS